MGKLTMGQLAFLIVLLCALSILVQIAVAKWFMERKQARLRGEAALAKRNAEKETRGSEGGVPASK